MKRIRFGGMLLLLALAFGFSPALVSNSSAVESFPKCECKYPNTDQWGVKDDKEGCKVVHCWIELTEE